MPAVPRPDPEALLAHAGWIRALALRLVRDESAADDVLQDTFVAAVERPPAPSVPLAPWLARVARNFALRWLRSGTRRAARERRTAAASPAASPDEGAARTEAFRDVVDAVLALDPLYRDVILLRYLDGLDVATVAERLGVPTETAKTRLKRALVLLRARLDARFGGRGVWAVALIPAAHELSGASVGAASNAGGASLLEGAIVQTSTKALAGAGLAGALLGGLATWAVVPRDAGLPGAERSAAGATAPELAGRARSDHVRANPELQGQPRLAVEDAPAPAALAGPVLPAVDLPPASEASITGRVLTREGVPVAGCTVRAWAYSPETLASWRARPSAPPGVQERIDAALRQVAWDVATARTSITDAAGAFRLGDLRDLSYSLGAHMQGYAVRLGRGFGGQARPGGVVEFVAEPVVALPVRVLLADGSPAPEASVSWALPMGGGGGGGAWRREDPIVEVGVGTWSVTAELGRALRSEPVTVEVALGAKPEEVTLRLLPIGRLVARLQFDPADQGWRYATLVLRPLSGAGEEHSMPAHAPDWSFAFERLEPGTYVLDVCLTPGVPVASFTYDLRGDALQPQLVAVPRLTPAHVLEVRAVGPGGVPLEEDDVSISLMERSASREGGRGTHAVRRADGVFLVPLGEDRAAQRRTWERARARRGGAGGFPAEMPEPPADAVHSVRVTSKAYGAKEAPYVPGTTARVDVSLP